MDKDILLILPAPFNKIRTKRVIGSTNRETQMLSTILFFKTKKYSIDYINNQLLIIGYTHSDIQKALKK